MTSAKNDQFHREVFPTEMAEVNRRRANVGDAPVACEDTDGFAPSTEHGLTGLACSGGGIRSAAFSMGIIQLLIRKGLFKRLDYLSTVSGGGFTGACVSALMHSVPDGDRKLVDRTRGEEPPAISHVRNYSNYLLGRGLLDGLRVPALCIAGALHTLLLVVPPVIAFVLLTEILFELGGRIIPGARHWLPVLGLVPFAIAILWRPVAAGLGSWSERDARQRRMGGFLLLAVCSVVAIPTVRWLGELVNHDAEWLLEQLSMFFTEQVRLGIGSWLLWVSVGLLGLLVLGFYTLRGQMLLILAGALGPLGLLSIYVFACVYTVTSPVVEDKAGLVDVVARLPSVDDARQTPCGTSARSEDEQHIERLVQEVLRRKGINYRNYQVQWQRESAESPLALIRCGPPVPWWQRMMFMGGSPTLHLAFKTAWLTGLGAERGPTRLVVVEELSILHGRTAWWLYIGALVLWLYNQRFVSVNRISMHPFYRDRLSRTFLIRPAGDDLESADELKLSELCAPNTRAPYHLVNTAMNLHGSPDPGLRRRKTLPMMLAPKFCGNDYTGYAPTVQMEDKDPQFNLGTAMAISAAAAAPNMGALQLRSLSFVMALLNIRLNYWLPNPSPEHIKRWHQLDLPGRVGLGYLMAEALGRVDDRSEFVNCSDGGHIENLGVYELLKRRCKTIICVDGEADPSYRFAGLTTLQRYAEIDFGARIDLDLDPLRPSSDRRTGAHYVRGRVRYSDGEEGCFIYMKLAYSGDEPEYLRYYRKTYRDFPHQSTGNQFFGEIQFEAYRALGVHTAEDALDEITAMLGT